MAKHKLSKAELTEFYPVHVPTNDNGTTTCAHDGEPWPCAEAVAAGEQAPAPDEADEAAAAGTDGEGSGA